MLVGIVGSEDLGKMTFPDGVRIHLGGLSSMRNVFAGEGRMLRGHPLRDGHAPHTTLCITFRNWGQYPPPAFMIFSPFLSKSSLQLSCPRIRQGGGRSMKRKSTTCRVVFSIIELHTMIYVKGSTLFKNERKPGRTLTVFLPINVGVLPA